MCSEWKNNSIILNERFQMADANENKKISNSMKVTNHEIIAILRKTIVLKLDHKWDKMFCSTAKLTFYHFNTLALWLLQCTVFFLSKLSHFAICGLQRKVLIFIFGTHKISVSIVLFQCVARHTTNLRACIRPLFWSTLSVFRLKIFCFIIWKNSLCMLFCRLKYRVQAKWTQKNETIKKI